MGFQLPICQIDETRQSNFELRKGPEGLSSYFARLLGLIAANKEI